MRNLARTAACPSIYGCARPVAGTIFHLHPDGGMQADRRTPHAGTPESHGADARANCIRDGGDGPAVARAEGPWRTRAAIFVVEVALWRGATPRRLTLYVKYRKLYVSWSIGSDIGRPSRRRKCSIESKSNRIGNNVQWLGFISQLVRCRLVADDTAVAVYIICSLTYYVWYHGMRLIRHVVH